MWPARLDGAKRSILVDRIGLPIAVRVDSAKPHDVAAGRLLTHEALPGLPRVSLVLADRGYRALDKAAQRHTARFEVRSRPPGTIGFKPLALVWRVETTFAQLGRWRRRSRCFEGSVESARAWLEVACFGYRPGRLLPWLKPGLGVRRHWRIRSPRGWDEDLECESPDLATRAAVVALAMGPTIDESLREDILGRWAAITGEPLIGGLRP